jgi:hypothetical protein
MKLKRYSTNLATTPLRYYPDPPYKGRGWQVTFGSAIHPKNTTTYIDGRVRVPKRIVVYAATEESAQNVVDLISAAVCIITEDCGDDPNFNKYRAFSSATKSRINRDTFDDFIPPTQVGDYQFACIVASKGSYRKYYQYALYKYRLSQRSFHTVIHDLDPSEWYSQRFVFRSPEHHVRCAQAIGLAYAVIEELGLEIRANQQNPSFINGAWNPKVKTDLEQRLIKAGVNLSEKELWTMRDTPTRIERERPVSGVKKARWAYSKIRDINIEVVDAIARASWLRSKVSAHRLIAISSSLNYYDVANMQYLARRLLLESLGLWHYHNDAKEV